MSYINTLSVVEAKILLKAVKVYQTALQAEIDFREDLITQSINYEGYSEEAVEIRQGIDKELKEKRHAIDETCALKIKLQAIIA